MSDVVIRVENLGKCYRIRHQAPQRYIALRDVLAHRLTDLARSPWRWLTAQRAKREELRAQGQAPSLAPRPSSPRPPSEDFWALKDVSFDVKQGEVVGIIGRNGAGKSTLLKILSRITEPTIGRVRIKGRVGSLLEVGTGFHPELTGRENIYLNGAILGMTKAEIKRKFDEIVAFAEVEKFLDTPVKHYSSGMYVRLAFAVAAHLEPEILLVDEVLAVGDAIFQKKCLGKMREVAKEGRTVLFVSHNMGAISRLCTRSILLSQGIVVFDGESDVAVRTHLKDANDNTARRVFFKEDDPNLPIVIRQVAVTSPGKIDTDSLDISEPLFVDIYYQVRQDVKGTNISFALKRDGVVLFRSWDIDVDQSTFELRKAGDCISRLALPQNLLTPGTYSIYVAAGRPGASAITQHDDCLTFVLENYRHDASHASYSRGGLLIVPLKWDTYRTNYHEATAS